MVVEIPCAVKRLPVPPQPVKPAAVRRVPGMALEKAEGALRPRESAAAEPQIIGVRTDIDLAGLDPQACVILGTDGSVEAQLFEKGAVSAVKARSFPERQHRPGEPIPQAGGSDRAGDGCGIL